VLNYSVRRRKPNFAHYERDSIMGRRKIDRSDKIMQTFETTKPLKVRLNDAAKEQGMTVSALIRGILEQFFEDHRA
jgi:hypothetical protein